MRLHEKFFEWQSGAWSFGITLLPRYMASQLLVGRQPVQFHHHTLTHATLVRARRPAHTGNGSGPSFDWPSHAGAGEAGPIPSSNFTRVAASWPGILDTASRPRLRASARASQA